LNTSSALLALALGAWAPAETPAAGAPAPAEARSSVPRVVLEVEHSGLLEHQMAVAAEKSAFIVQNHAVQSLKELHKVEVVDDSTAPVILVKLAWKDYGNSVYSIEVSTRRPGQEAELVESFEATCINNSALTDAVLARLPAALKQLEEREPVVTEPRAEPETVEPLVEPLVEPPAEHIDDVPRRPLGTLGRAGIGVAVVGAGALVGGGVVYALKHRFEAPTGRALDLDGRNYKPPGIALMVAGGAALVAGATLLIIDRTRARKSASALLLPSPGGFVMSGRF
jgi:hypothetical protein